jgi:lysyl-tRNA synthetase, class II
VRLRRPAPFFLALGATFAGVIGVVSALTPEFADRFQLVRGVLPPGVPEAAKIVALAFGLALIWLSRGLARRKRRAWQLAVCLVAVSAAAHLAKGLDVEEATISVLLLAALWRYRSEFTAPGEPAVLRPLARVLVALVTVGGLLTLRLSDSFRVSERIETALVVLAALLTFRALYLWLRPLRDGGLHTAEEGAQARAVVRGQGRDSLAYFSLRGDKSYLFSATRRTFLAYRVVNGTALVSGDPIGEPAEVEDLLREFRRIAHASGWRVAALGTSEELVPLYRRLGFHAVYLGDEAVVRPADFTLEGRPIRKVRQSVTRLRKAGYRVRILRVAEVDADLRREIASVSSEWRGRSPERGFTMAMDALWSYPDSVLVLAHAPDGRIGGFLHLVPSPACGGWSLATMRRRRDTPNGLMEFLIVESIRWARFHEAGELSLNFSVFAKALSADRHSPLSLRILRIALLRFDRFFQLERLHSFNRKFFPVWRPRFVCFERWTDAPLVALAYLHVEQLLTPPGPWVRDEDLAAV